jgi:hypothetical protein
MCGRINCDCTFEGVGLFGTYRVRTDGLAMFRVQVGTTGLEDLKVQTGLAIADSCGEWREGTTGLEKFTVEFVTNGLYDFSIRYVTSLPGVGRPPN